MPMVILVTEERTHDVVVFGATGFTGRRVASYLAEHAKSGARIALAGRSMAKLRRVRDELGAGARDWPLLVAEAGDPPSLADMARSTRVLATTVGPYRRHGLPVVAACAESGTDYVDLSGEVLFMRESIDRYDGAAKASGARIVHACGFDSVPSDLGVLLLHEAASRDGAGGLVDTTLVVTAVRGGVSGGTWESAKAQVDESRASRRARQLIADPYALSPDRSAEPELGPQRSQRVVRRDADLRVWTAPFVMAGTNSRVVRRSNALQEWAYGRRFRYGEVMGFGPRAGGLAKAAAVTGMLWAGAAALSLRPSRVVLDRILPDAGKGPGARSLRDGFFRMELHAWTASGARYVAHVAARGDPGYAATARMLGESALCLAFDRVRLPDRSGVLTPATAMGAPLVIRLRDAGMVLSASPLTARG